MLQSIGRGSGAIHALHVASTSGGINVSAISPRTFAVVQRPNGAMFVAARGLAGHSKWANIKHKKAKNDQAREKNFTALSRQISAAVHHGGGSDLSQNYLLNSLVHRAKKAGVPNANIDRAIDRGSGKGHHGPLEKHVYEGSKGIALFIVEVLTDSKTRAVAEVRHVFKKYGGAVSNNSAGFAFETRGAMEVDVPENKNEEQIALDALECGLDSDIFDEYNVVDENPSKRKTMILYCAPADLQASANMIREMGYNVYHEEMVEYAKQKVEITEDEVADSIHSLVNALEELDDVTKVFHNLA